MHHDFMHSFFPFSSKHYCKICCARALCFNDLLCVLKTLLSLIKIGAIANILKDSPPKLLFTLGKLRFARQHSLKVLETLWQWGKDLCSMPKRQSKSLSILGLLSPKIFHEPQTRPAKIVFPKRKCPKTINAFPQCTMPIGMSDPHTLRTFANY